MTVKLNRSGLDYAKKLIKEGRVTPDEHGDWSDHQPSTKQENDFIEKHGYAEYAKWHLAIDTEQNDDTKGKYKFPYGDFSNVHRGAVLSAESRAGQNKYHDIQDAAADLHVLIDGPGETPHGKARGAHSH
jgi:hypothetical protein